MKDNLNTRERSCASPEQILRKTSLDGRQVVFELQLRHGHFGHLKNRQRRQEGSHSKSDDHYKGQDHYKGSYDKGSHSKSDDHYKGLWHACGGVEREYRMAKQKQ